MNPSGEGKEAPDRQHSAGSSPRPDLGPVAARGGAPGVLVVGYGNTLRGDDGVGRIAADLLAADPRLVGATVLARHQLTPELAQEISESALTVFIDAGQPGPPGAISVTRVSPGDAGRDAATTHRVGPASLLALALELWDSAPPTFVVSVGVESMEVGERLSPAVERALPDVVERVVTLVLDGE